MRELKFRLWSKRTKRYITTCIVGGVEYNEISAFDLFGLRSDPQFQSDVIIEQYTGLKDKNGKEIYEGDIVNMPSSECAVVDYDAGSFTLNCSHCSATWTMDRWCSELGIGLDNICKSIEVIGNIHENKEFLGGEE